MSGPARWACLALILLQWGTVAGAENGALPDLELLEFLGMFATDDGEWVDPTDWIGEEPPPGPALDVLGGDGPRPPAPGALNDD